MPGQYENMFYNCLKGDVEPKTCIDTFGPNYDQGNTGLIEAQNKDAQQKGSGNRRRINRKSRKSRRNRKSRKSRRKRRTRKY